MTKETPFEAIVRHAIDDAPPWCASDSSGPWPIPRDAHPDLGHYIAGRVLAYYAAIHGVANVLEVQEGLVMLRLLPANVRVLALGAPRIYQRLWLFQVPVIPPFVEGVVRGLFQPGGVLWLYGKTLERLAGNLVVAEEEGAVNTLTLVELLRALGEGRAPGEAGLGRGGVKAN